MTGLHALPTIVDMLLPSLLCLLVTPQTDEPLPLHPLDRVVELEFTAYEPLRYEYESEFEGTLHVWTSSELDLALQVEQRGDASVFGEDDNSGGGDTPYVRLKVERGDGLTVHVTRAEGAEAAIGALTLHMIAAPETAATRAAALAAGETRKVADKLIEEGNHIAARKVAGTGIQVLRETEGADYSQNIADAEWGLIQSCHRTGDLATSSAGLRSARRKCDRTLPVDHPDLLKAHLNLATMISSMGDLAGARTLCEAVLSTCERTLPADHPNTLRARTSLANLMSRMGDIAGARLLRESVLTIYERTLPADHPLLLAARFHLAGSMNQAGELAGARMLLESVLEARERTLPADHSGILLVRMNLAVSMKRMGDLAGARALYESVLSGFERTLPADHPDLLGARMNLAILMAQMGDLEGARALQDAVLAACERTLPADHPLLLSARMSQASTTWQMGDLADARTQFESIVSAYERTLPVDHPDVLNARGNRATMLKQDGDHAGAQTLYEAVLSVYERTLPADHPKRLATRQNLTLLMHKMGDLPAARALYESVLTGYERTLAGDHPNLLSVRQGLVISMFEMGDLAEARTLLPRLCAGMMSRILASLALAPRQARQTVGTETERLGWLHFASEFGQAELRADVFEVTETMRLVASEAARSLASFADDSELAPVLAAADEVRRAQGDLIGGATQSARSSEEIAVELTRLSLKRDRLEREASMVLAERGIVVRAVETTVLAETLDEAEAAIGFRRLARCHLAKESGRASIGADHLMAHVLRSDGILTLVDLGPAAELEELVNEWRAALGASLLRGIAMEVAEENLEASSGVRLRQRLLDPILAAAGANVHRIFLCPDDLVYLVPLEALPTTEDGTERLGDRVRIVSEVSFARLLTGTQAIESLPSLLALGGVDYGAEGSVPKGHVAVAAPLLEEDEPTSEEEANEARSSNNATPTRFGKLLQSRYEAEATADLFEETFEVNPKLLTRRDTTKAALFEAVPGKRFVHLATHGWFAPESVKSTEDARPNEDSFTRMSVEERITGFAPMTLCGLALAGANHGADSLGRVKGILTAEELCTLDLSQCELAVLSACETNVGIRRAGQGIQSLQAALYAAGARTSITSLWKVDDAATRRLMELFYTNLWIEKMPKSEALWSAKVTMREEGHPPAHWAGWVMTGDPE